MAWLKIDDGFNENAKIENLRDRTFRVHVSGLVYCAKNLTDGYLNDKAVKVLAVLLGFQVKRHIPELMEARLWTPDEVEGYWIKDYLIYNPDSETVKKLREERSEAGKRGAAKRWSHDNGHSNSHRQVPWQAPMADVDAPVPAQPVPLKNFKAVPADQEIEHEIDKILRCVTDEDEGSRGVITSFAGRLPIGSVAKVRESCETRRKGIGVGYVVRALQSELDERSAA